jgi:hypothetical protein
MNAKIDQKFRIRNMMLKNVSLDLVLYFSGFFLKILVVAHKPDRFWKFSPGSGK